MSPEAGAELAALPGRRGGRRRRRGHGLPSDRSASCYTMLPTQYPIGGRLPYPRRGPRRTLLALGVATGAESLGGATTTPSSDYDVATAAQPSHGLSTTAGKWWCWLEQT
ncbi:hypothetical protein [Streptosporangium vulgare]|uniref:hypothetical protein n=1 Tax=Streptosporangium vulgare TaxID=46190 RepID=UPI0031CEC2B5